jgi:hypothetical protein
LAALFPQPPDDFDLGDLTAAPAALPEVQHEPEVRERRRGARGRRAGDTGQQGQPLDPLEAETRENARRRLMAVKQHIQAKSSELLLAEPGQLQTLTQELQRLRVAMLMLREIVEDVADPTTYRELNLLNKMITGHDPSEEALRKEQAQGEQDAVERLANVGLTRESAGGMVRVLQSLQGVMNRRNGQSDEEHTHE